MPTSIKSKMYLFADDAKLYWEINNDMNVKTLPKDLKNFEDWSNNSLLKFNDDKCIQRQDTQMVIGLQDLSYNEWLQKLDLPSFEYRRRRETMIEMFKIGYICYDPKATKETFDLSKRDNSTNDSKV